MSIQYNNNEIIVSAEHAMAMMLVKAKEISNNANASNINSTSIVPVSDIVIAVSLSFITLSTRICFCVLFSSICIPHIFLNFNFMNYLF
jgi:hypothetical protein